MTRIRLFVLVVATLVGGAWLFHGRSADTVAAPLDVLLEQAAGTTEEGCECTEAVSGSDAAADAEPLLAEDVKAEVVEPEVVEPEVAPLATHLYPRAEWDLPKAYNDRVEYWIEFLAGRNRDRTQLWLEREGRYGTMIRQRLHERGMPQDLIYLGMIESGLSPKAYSHAHASGLWQFIASTGKQYGLRVDGYVDERRDPVKATDAALDYLEYLYERFGSWYLAAAAYNSGENRVERILRQRAGGRKGDDGLFWVIDGYLPRETRDYVPLMLAAAHIGKNPGAYGFREIILQAPLAYDEVEVPGGVSLRSVAETAGVDREALEELNTHLMRGVTPPGESAVLRVPEGSSRAVLAVVDRLEQASRRALLDHRVRRGETLSHIARSYGVRVADLRAANGGLNPRRLQVGQRVRVPVVEPGSGGAVTWKTYRVRTGDTLWEIARRYGVSVGELRSWNGIGTRIYPGQRLRLAS